MAELELLRSNVVRLCRGFLLAFAVMSVVLVYWHAIEAPSLRAAPINPRARERLKLTQPGRILTTDGVTVLEGVRGDKEWYLDYPGGEVYCHLTGYDSKSGLQPALADALYARGEYEDPWVRILRGRPTGCDVTLTIHGQAQETATRLMRGHRGAVVAVDPRSGAIRVMVSAPAYNPSTVLATPTDYQLFRNLPDKPELNRALLGQYPPGSTIKILVAAAALAQGMAKPTDEFECKGQVTIGGAVIHCRRPGGHGRITLTEALADSCNVVFAGLGRALGPDALRRYVEQFHLLEAPELPLPSRGGRMATMAGPNAEAEAAEAAFGQGATLVSPAVMARLAATFARGGTVPQLQLVESVTNARGKVLERLIPGTVGQAVSEAVARQTTAMLVEVVERGTGRRAAIRGVKVAGKTGSAENPHGDPHAWFVGYAPADSPRVVVAVIVENGGSGGEVAAPIAREVMRVLLDWGG